MDHLVEDREIESRNGDHDRVAKLSLKEVESGLLEAIVENLPDMVFVKDAKELRFVRFNKAGEKLLGFPREHMIGKNDYDLFPKAEADFFTEKDREVLRGGVLVNIPEEPIHTRTSGTRILHTKKIPILGDDGEPRYLLGISEDITDQRETESRLRELNASLERRGGELERAVADLESFSSSVSHDLRAPLRGVDGFSLMLLEDYADKLDDRGKHALSRIRAASQQMDELMDGLLRLARNRPGEIVRDDVELSSMATQILENLRVQEPERVVDFRVAPNLLTCGDPTLLFDVMKNLLENAWKFSRNAASATIEVDSVLLEGRTVFFVRDNGVGFDPALQHHLFRSFSRLHSDADFEGSGVGLATVARIIRRHGGRIWAESPSESGATFFFTL